MTELRRKVSALLDGNLHREVLVDLLIDVIARGLGRLGGRPPKGGMTHVESDVSKPVSKPENGGLFSGSGSSLVLTPESSQPIEEISELDEPPGFLEFWALYPRKVAKTAARRAWRRKRPPITKVRAALAWQRRDPWWLQGNAPHPATYINAGRWEDEPPRTPTLTQREARNLVVAAEFVEEGNGRSGR